MLMTLEEKEKQLVEEIAFFNQNIAWWGKEVDRVNTQISNLKKKFGEDYESELMDKLVASLTYLAGKAKVEQHTASIIEKKINKLHLEKQLDFIQGDFLIQKPKRNKKRKNQ